MPDSICTVCAPAKLPAHPGERLADFFDAMFKTLTAISTLGASMTFAKIVTGPAEPFDYHGLPAVEIQNYIANAFVCFTITLFLTTLAASALVYWRSKAISYFGTEDTHQRRIVAWYATLVSLFLSTLIIIAFVFLAIVVAGYTGTAGWIVLGFTGLMAIVVLSVIMWQSPIGSSPLSQVDLGRPS